MLRSFNIISPRSSHQSLRDFLFLSTLTGVIDSVVGNHDVTYQNGISTSTKRMHFSFVGAGQEEHPYLA